MKQPGDTRDGFDTWLTSPECVGGERRRGRVVAKRRFEPFSSSRFDGMRGCVDGKSKVCRSQGDVSVKCKTRYGYLKIHYSDYQMNAPDPF